MAGERIATRGEGTRYVGRDTAQVPDIGMTRVDSEIYTSPEHWELERELIFRNTWFVVARSSEIADPGQFLVWE